MGPSTTAGHTHLEAMHVSGEIKAVNLLSGASEKTYSLETGGRGGGEEKSWEEEGGEGGKI